MSLDKAILYKKEYRKPYRKAKAFVKSCRNNNSCSYCKSNRIFFDYKKRKAAEIDMDDFNKQKQYELNIWNNLDQNKVKFAIDFLRNHIPIQIKNDIKMAIKNNPNNWISSYHFGWGMNIRNILRQNGFNEEYMECENLDYIYTQLIELAMENN